MTPMAPPSTRTKTFYNKRITNQDVITKLESVEQYISDHGIEEDKRFEHVKNQLFRIKLYLGIMTAASLAFIAWFAQRLTLT